MKWFKDESIDVLMTVSDRASALLRVAKTDYLDTFSMPDLFHFMQDLSKSVGGRLGLQASCARKKLSGTDCESVNYDLLKQDLLEKEDRQKEYKSLREWINKVVHPFDKDNNWTTSDGLRLQLQLSFTRIRLLAKDAGFEVSLKKGNKILNQIPDLADGVAYWVEWLKTETGQLDLGMEEKRWLEQSLLPYAYWQVHQRKMTTKKKNRELNQYYRQRVKQAENKFEQDSILLKISEQKKEELINCAFKQVATFHRASSSVEGRNGYLSFFNRAHRSIPKRRKKVLMVIHNYDIRRADGKTPAERLFNKEFPNLFEFILGNIGELPRPRSRKMKNAITN